MLLKNQIQWPCVYLQVLITFQSPVYTGWNDGRPVSIGTHGVDAVWVNAVGKDKTSERTMKNGGVLTHVSNVKSMQTSNSKENGGDVPSTI